MTAMNILRKELPIARISRAICIPGSSIYCGNSLNTGRRKPRVSDAVRSEVLRIAGERTTCGYRRIWALMRNHGTRVNVKTVRRIMNGRRDLTKPDAPDRLWETDTHYISTGKDGMAYLMFIKDCYSKAWISYKLSRSCTAGDCMKAVEMAYAKRFTCTGPAGLILRTDNGPQYVAREFREPVKIMAIGHEYIRKHTPEENGDIESFHSSLKTDYIWINDIETFEDARNLMEYAFTDYNTVMPHSSIGYLPPGEFEGRWNASQEFREEFLEKRKAKHERDIRRREEKKRRLKENVSLEDELSVQN